MDQEKAVNRMLRDLKMFGLLVQDTANDVRPYLNAMYVAGWEQGWLDAHQTTAKAIGQYNIEGKLIATYPSLKIACRRTGFSKSGIQHSIKNNIPTRQRWYWKFLVEGKPKLS